MRKTEMPNEMSPGIDACAAGEILATLHEAQMAAAASVAGALTQIEAAAKLIVSTISAGGRLGYAGAGSSGLMAMADGLELPGTFSIPADNLTILLAGGTDILSHMPGGPEDDERLAMSDIEKSGLGRGDCLICVSASGTTPYAVAALEAAARKHIATIGMANNDQTPVLEMADIAIYLNTPPEIVAGSTRMGAGTAQKIALNMLSTLWAIHLGHVHDGYMVNVHADNAKLRARAARIVASVAACTVEAAHGFLGEADGSVKVAILLAAGAKNPDTANQLLERNGQKLRPSLALLSDPEPLKNFTAESKGD